MSAANQIFQFLVFLLGQTFRLYGVHTNGLANARGHFKSVAREDAHFAHAQFAQPRNHLAGILAQLVLQTNRAQVASAQHHMHATHAFDSFTGLVNRGGDGWVGLQEPLRATSKHLSI